MSLIPVRKDTDGMLKFRVNYDEMPEGFLDGLDDSDFVRLTKIGKAYVEVGHPVVDDHIDPRIALMRLRQIYPERVCGQIVVPNVDNDGFTAILCEHGPHAHLLKYLDSIKKLFVAPRLVFNVDGEYSNVVTFDVVEVN